MARIYPLFAVIILASCTDYGKDGLEAFDQGNYVEALEMFSIALSRSPNNESYHYNKARTLEELEMYEEALVEYSWVVRNSPMPSDAYLGRGRCYWKMED